MDELKAKIPAGKRFINLSGHTYGRLTVLGYAGKKGRKPHWHCKCNCGNTSIVRGDHLRGGGTQSCGCYSRERSSEGGVTHALFIDLTGHIYGRLTVLSYAGKKGRATRWNCECECGNSKVIAGCDIRSGHTKSCGCYHKERTSYVKTTHGMSGNTEYNSWACMKNRCYSISDKAYKYYGDRGIIVCDRWLESFDNFYADMGDKPTPSHSIDRINNDGNYEPNNCRWATKREQAINRRMQNNNTSGVTGVSWRDDVKKWSSKICVNGNQKYLGSFTDKTKAIDARQKAEMEHCA